jgi:hypothetical protein
MQSHQIFEIPVLDVDKAIRVTQEYVRELEEQNPEGLTACTTKTLSNRAKPQLSFFTGIRVSSETTRILSAGYR